MPVSEQMINACNKEADEFLGQLDNPYEVAQATINAAWVPFNIEDRKTWPKFDKEYLIQFNGTIENARFDDYVFPEGHEVAWRNDEGLTRPDPDYYAYPSILMKSELLYVQPVKDLTDEK